jgi:tetratricopeptide (TPR) repeat protein
MRLPPEFRPIVLVWLVVVGLFLTVLAVFPPLTREFARLDRYALDERIHTLINAGDSRTAVRESLVAVGMDPLDIEARYALGEALEANGDLIGAAAEFTRAAETMERHSFVRAKDRSQEYRFWFRYRFARHEWFDALSAFCLLPENDPWVTNEVLANAITAATEVGSYRYTVALGDEPSLEQMLPSDTTRCTEFALTCLYAGTKQVAEKAFERAAQGGSDIAAFHAGMIALERGDREKAEGFFERARPGPKEYGLARVCQAQGKLAEANELYRKMLEAPAVDIEWLCNAWDAAQKTGDGEQVQRVVQYLYHLNPQFVTWHEVKPALILAGVSFDTLRLSSAGYATATFFWRLPHTDEKDRGRLVVVKKEDSNLLARFGDMCFHKATVRNPLCEPGLEVGGSGQRYPLGFCEDLDYQHPPDQRRIIRDEQPNHDGDLCLCMAGTKKATSSRITSRRFKVTGGQWYVIGGYVRTRGGTAQFTWNWFDALKREVAGSGWNEIRRDNSPQWGGASRLVRAPHSAASCSIALGNWLSEGESYFDDIFLIEVPLERAMLDLL